MENNVTMNKVKVVEHGGKGMLWIAGWLFTIGFVHLTFWQGVLAVVIWPFYLGRLIEALIR